LHFSVDFTEQSTPGDRFDHSPSNGASFRRLMVPTAPPSGLQSQSVLGGLQRQVFFILSSFLLLMFESVLFMIV